MSLINSDVIPASETLEISDNDVSLRFNNDDSAYLTRTQGSGNRRTFTYSGWVKRSSLITGTDYHSLITWQNSSGNSDWDSLKFNNDTYSGYADGCLMFEISGGSSYALVTTALYKDFSSWYHVVLSVDTTQATASNRVKLYVNGSQITSFNRADYPPQNHDCWVNLSGRTVAIGANWYSSPNKYYDGYMSEVNFIDGQALDSSYFGQTVSSTWIPKDYTGSYGTNGFYLNFKVATEFGNDFSGNNNDFTSSNLVETDQVLARPETNFATWDDNNKGTQCTLSEGALKYTLNTLYPSQPCCASTIGLTSGKWYCEATVVATGGGNHFGIVNDSESFSSLGYLGQSSNSWGYAESGTKYHSASSSSYGGSYTAGDVIGLALDLNGHTLSFYKNGTSLGTAYSSLATDTYYIATGDGDCCVYHSLIVNFGQDSTFSGNLTRQSNTDGNGYGDFYYTPPTGYLAICDANL